MGSEYQLAARRAERIQVRMPVTLCVDSNGETNDHTVLTVDLSNNGVRVCARAGLVPGQAVAIVIDSGQEVTLPGRVVWIGQAGTRLQSHAGIEFLKPVTPPV